MAKITYMPWQEVILHAITELENKEFFEAIVVAGYNPNNPNAFPIVTWIDGIAFTVAYFPDTEDSVREKMQGKIHGMVIFTKIAFRENYPLSNTIKVILTKRVDDPTFFDIVDFLKSFKTDPRVKAKNQA
jgi:hypothetical protein